MTDEKHAMQTAIDAIADAEGRAEKAEAHMTAMRESLRAAFNCADGIMPIYKNEAHLREIIIDANDARWTRLFAIWSTCQRALEAVDGVTVENKVANFEAVIGGLCAYPLCRCGTGPECKVLDAPIPEVCARSDLIELKVEYDDLLGVLATIHRDGGHHTMKVGLKQSVVDAIKCWSELMAARDELNRRLMDAETDRDHWKSEFYLHHSCNKTEWELRTERDRLAADNARLRDALGKCEGYFDHRFSQAVPGAFNPAPLPVREMKIRATIRQALSGSTHSGIGDVVEAARKVRSIAKWLDGHPDPAEDAYSCAIDEMKKREAVLYQTIDELDEEGG